MCIRDRDKEKSPTLAAAVQRQLNRALKHVYPLPLFSLLNIDRDTYGTMLDVYKRQDYGYRQSAGTLCAARSIRIPPTTHKIRFKRLQN